MNHYLLAFFGSFLYNAVIFVVAKNNCDKAEPPVDFQYKKYAKMNWDNWGLTFCFAPVVVWFLPDFAKLANEYLLKTMGFQLPEDLYYLGAGPLTEVVMYFVLKYSGRKESFVPPVHVDPKP